MTDKPFIIERGTDSDYNLLVPNLNEIKFEKTGCIVDGTVTTLFSFSEPIQATDQKRVPCDYTEQQVKEIVFKNFLTKLLKFKDSAQYVLIKNFSVSYPPPKDEHHYLVIVAAHCQCVLKVR